MRERYEGSHKFGHDPFTAWLWEQSLDPAAEDEQFGSVNWYGWYARMGRHVLVEEPSGEVWRAKLSRGERDGPCPLVEWVERTHDRDTAFAILWLYEGWEIDAANEPDTFPTHRFESNGRVTFWDDNGEVLARLG